MLITEVGPEGLQYKILPSASPFKASLSAFGLNRKEDNFLPNCLRIDKTRKISSIFLCAASPVIIRYSVFGRTNVTRDTGAS